MSFTPAPWVPDSIKEYVRTLEESCENYSESEQARWRRLVTNPRLQKFYENPYLVERLTDKGWVTLFICVCGAAGENFQALRRNLDKHKKALANLQRHLTASAMLLREIENLSAMDSLPSALFDPFSLLDCAAKRPALQAFAGDEHNSRDEMRVLYSWDIAPVLEPVKRFDTRYYPSVPELVETLSNLVEVHIDQVREQGPSMPFPWYESALTSREYQPFPIFVRHVDEAMIIRGNWDEIHGPSFLIPAEAMVLVAEVAFNEYAGRYTVKQVQSARDLKSTKQRVDENTPN